MLWGLAGVAAVLIGFRFAVPLWRRTGLAVLALVAAKVVLLDVPAAGAGPGGRIVSLFVVGTLMLATSYVYGRAAGRATGPDDAAPSGPAG